LETHRAEIPVGFLKVSEPLADIAEKNGYVVERLVSKTRIIAPLGQVSFAGDENHTKLSFSSQTKAELQLFKELYADRLKKLGLDTKIKWEKSEGSIPFNQIRCKVSSCRRISNNFERIRLQGDFSVFDSDSAGLHFRFLLGPAGVGWPYLDDNGLTLWPLGISEWHRPVFTVRKIAIDADWIEVDIALHTGGRITNWLKELKVGDEIAINGPSGSKMPKADNMFLFGDETAMPAIMRIIENSPPETCVNATVALRDAKDLQVIPSGKQVAIKTVKMEDESALLKELYENSHKFSGCYLFFAAERGQSSKAREFIKTSSISVKSSKISSYWTKTN
tara:strand:+ start:318 stop:1322 length:1005 start_codon:yes stop_codon:yes gene_type:complete